MRHKGIRPTHVLEVLSFKKKTYIEIFPDGGYRVWNKRQLKSGCGKYTDVERHEIIQDCYYCKHCREWFNEEQWEKQ